MAMVLANLLSCYNLTEQTRTDMSATVRMRCGVAKISRHYGVGPWVCAVLVLV